MPDQTDRSTDPIPFEQLTRYVRARKRRKEIAAQTLTQSLVVAGRRPSVRVSRTKALRDGIADEQVPGVEQERVLVLALRLLDHRSRARQAPEGAVELRILGAERVEVGVRVVDVQDRNRLPWKRRGQDKAHQQGQSRGKPP